MRNIFQPYTWCICKVYSEQAIETTFEDISQKKNSHKFFESQNPISQNTSSSQYDLSIFACLFFALFQHYIRYKWGFWPWLCDLLKWKCLCNWILGRRSFFLWSATMLVNCLTLVFLQRVFPWKMTLFGVFCNFQKGFVIISPLAMIIRVH